MRLERVVLPVFRKFISPSIGLDLVFLILTIDKGGAAMKHLITRIAKALVDNPEQVNIKEIKGNQTSVLELRVAKRDIGKIIGRQGRTAQAMRIILSAASAKTKKRTMLEIME
jgi:predicted RNA-binding protein YlqC (UPF0109 family)